MGKTFCYKLFKFIAGIGRQRQDERQIVKWDILAETQLEDSAIILHKIYMGNTWRT